MNKLLLFFFFWILASNVNAQTGYFGNKTVLSLGTSFAPPLLNMRNRLRNSQYSKDLRIESDWAALPPEARISLDITLSKKVQFSISGSWRGLQNTKFYSTTKNEYPSSIFTFIDSFEMKNNTLDVGGSFKFFGRNSKAPIGTYFELGAGISHITSEVYPTYYGEKYSLTSNETTSQTDKRKPKIYTSNDYYIQLGVGATQILTRRLLIDYGARSSFIIGTYKFGPEYNPFGTAEFSYQNYLPEIIKFTQTTNLQSSYVLEIYLNLGISL